MKHIRSLEEISLKNAWLTIGVFDGVHRGHRQIIRKLVEGARAANSPSVVLTFDPHPASVLTGREIKSITTADERASLLDSLGVDVTITQRFTPDLSHLTAHQYMSTLKQTLDLKRLLIGYDFALGKGREGNATRLTELGKEMDYEVDVTPAFADESGAVSSTAIRKLIAAGNVSEAAKLLGRNHTISGEVIHGDGRGRRINIPTCNINYPTSKALPSNGIYACWAHLGGEKFMAATNIGFNPTFTPERQTASLEAHLLDFDRDIYGKSLTIEFVSRLRDELKFDSVQALLDQIWEDIDQTRAILSLG